MYITTKAQSAASTTLAAAAASTTSQVAIFNVIAGEPGAGTQCNLNVPGSNKLNGQQFRVRVSGLIAFTGAGYTGTATVQPLLYASTTSGFTAGASTAVLSAAAVNVILTNATAATVKYVPFSVEAWLQGDGTSGLLAGQAVGQVIDPAGVITEFPATAANGTWSRIVNAPSSVNFATEPPLQFAAGVTVVGGVTGAVISMSQFELEA